MGLVSQLLYYNAVLFFMVAAFTARVFKSYEAWVDVCTIKKPINREQIILLFKDDAVKAFIFP